MDSNLWWPASLLAMTLVFSLLLFLSFRHSRRSSQEFAQRLMTMQAATLKVSYSSTEAIVETIQQMSEDSRSQLVAMTNTSRQMATEHLEATSRLAEQLQQAARETAFRQAAEMQRYERLIAGPHASLTSMLTRTISLLGTKDAIAYRTVAGAEVPPDVSSAPYTTGDELETERRQQQVDQMFEHWAGGMTDGAGDGSDLADFGVAGV